MNFRKIFLLIIPIIFLVTGLQFHRTLYSNDPEYAYLLNGLNTATLKAVGATENPGTTVQIYSAIALRVAHLAGKHRADDLQTDVLKNPDHFIEIERKGLIAINTLILLLLGFYVFKYTKNIWIALILQLAPLLSSTTLEHVWSKISPEAFLLGAANILIIITLKFYYDENKQDKRYPWYFAAVCGFGIATKLTFLPLIVIPAFVLPLKNQKKTFFIALIPMFILFTINAFTQYPHMAKFFFGLSVHTGVYGSGEVGIIDPVQFFKDLIHIITRNISLSAGLFLGITTLIALIILKPLKSWLKDQLSVVFLASIILAQIAGILMVAKHYHGNHYLIPEISLAGMVFLFVFQLLNSYRSGKYRIFIRMFPVLIIAISVGRAFLNIPYLKAADHGYVMSNIEYEQLQKDLDNKYTDYIKTYYYPTSINPYSAFSWGNVYSRDRHVKKLTLLYPDAVIFDSRTMSFNLWGTKISTEELFKKYNLKKILIIGGPLDKNELRIIEKKGIKLNSKYIGRTQSIYEIDSLTLASRRIK